MFNRVVMNEASVRALLGEKVFIPTEKVCDIILREDGKEETSAYVNLMTGKKGGPTDVIRRNFNFVLRQCHSVEDFIESHRGLYAAPSKKEDALIILCCVLKKKEDGTYCWTEEKCDWAHADANMTFRAFVSKSFIIKYNRVCSNERAEYVDICGNIIYDEEQGAGFSGIKNTLYDYLGNVVIYKSFDNYCIETNVLALIDSMDASREKLHVTYNIMEHGNIPELGDIPADVKEKLSIFADNYDMETVYSYLQKTDSGFVQREFFASRFCPINSDNKYKFFEIQRTLFDAGAFKISRQFFPTVFWYDGYGDDSAEKPFSGTAQEILDCFLDTAWAGIGKADINDVNKCFVFDTGVSTTEFVKGLYLLSQNKVAYAILNCGMSISDAKQFFAEFTTWNECYHPHKVFKKLFGEIDEDGKDIDEMLGIPKGMFIKVIRNGGFTLSVIGKCKELFYNNKQFFMSMNKEDYTSLIQDVMYTPKKNLDKVAALIDLSGKPGNWKVFLTA